MSKAPFRIELLQKQDRSALDRGNSELNAYFQAQVGQDVRRTYATCFVAMNKEEDRIAGFYTLAMGSVPLGELPEEVAKRLPRYPQVPVVQVGRLAVDERYQGEKLGGSLLVDAIARSIDSEVAAYAVIVEAKDKNAIAFYEHFGFLKLTRNPRTLFLSISSGIRQPNPEDAGLELLLEVRTPPYLLHLARIAFRSLWTHRQRSLVPLVHDSWSLKKIAKSGCAICMRTATIRFSHMAAFPPQR